MYCGLWQASDEAIRSLLEGPESAVRELPGREGGGLDLEKDWHALHFLLTGSAWEGAEPLCYLVVGGTPFENVDDGYGFFRALGSGQVAAFAGALSPVTAETLRARYDPQAMSRADIYPGIWDREDDGETLSYLIESFEDLKSFITDAADNNQGVIIFLG